MVSANRGNHYTLIKETSMAQPSMIQKAAPRPFEMEQILLFIILLIYEYNKQVRRDNPTGRLWWPATLTGSPFVEESAVILLQFYIYY